MFNILIHESTQDQGVLDAIENKSSRKEIVVGTAAIVGEGLIFLKENYKERFVTNQWAIRRIE